MQPWASPATPLWKKSRRPFAECRITTPANALSRIRTSSKNWTRPERLTSFVECRCAPGPRQEAEPGRRQTGRPPGDGQREGILRPRWSDQGFGSAGNCHVRRWRLRRTHARTGTAESGGGRVGAKENRSGGRGRRGETKGGGRNIQGARDNLAEARE